MRKLVLTIVLSTMGSAAVLYGCHADENDPAGQAGELGDPVRRENAVANIVRMYTTKLSAHDGDRSHAEVKAIADATVEKLTQTYLDHPEDTQNRAAIVNLLYEMRDPRSLPALVQALDWRSEVSEDPAIRAAQTLKVMEIPEDKKGEVIEALSEALDKITGARGVDNRMRIEFIRALGDIDDRRATPILTKIATTQTEEQNFLINRLAAQQLGRLEDPAAVPAMIKGLFLFAPNNPAMRMNDVAAEALVRIGRPSFEPLLAVLRGSNEDVNTIVTQYIEAVRQRDEQAANSMSVEGLRSAEATFALGALGVADALEPILAEAREEDLGRRLNAAVALVRLNLSDAQRAQMRDTLKTVYQAQENPMAKAQLLAAMRHTYDAALLPFLLDEVRNDRQLPDIRLVAVESYAMLANKQESAALRTVIDREPASEDGGFKENFQAYDPALAVANECDEDVACWIGKLGADDKLVVRKAAYMLGRFGRGNDDAISALTDKLGHPEIEVRLAAIQALDAAATSGNSESIDAAVTKINQLEETEEGRSIWNNFSREALPIQARLRHRASS
jgi:HEAT repeat protein